MGKMRRTKREGKIPQDVRVSFAWYREDQWDRLLELASDRDQLEATFDEWRVFAEGHIDELRRRGVEVVKVEVDVEQLCEWCLRRGRPFDAAARSEYSARISRRASEGLENNEAV